jgi:hypothetical protein
VAEAGDGHQGCTRRHERRRDGTRPLHSRCTAVAPRLVDDGQEQPVRCHVLASFVDRLSNVRGG